METKFGVNQVKTETPQWAKWMFRGVLIVTSAVTFVIASDPSIEDSLKVRLNVYTTALNLVVLGFSKMFGVNTEEDK